MDSSRFLECLEADYRRIREVAPGHLDAVVPTCPDWTVADLVRHIAQVYLHKAEIMRHGEQPEEWPPAGFGAAEPLALLDRCYAELRAEFDARGPGDTVSTWYGPDQTAGFWIRRMAQETVIHRIDAELGAGALVAPVPDDLAVDGIDELLKIFVGWAFSQWPEDFTAALRDSPGHGYAIRADPGAGLPGTSWLVRTAPDRLSVEGGPGGETDGAVAVDVTVSGPPAAVLRWAWNRGPAATAAGPAGALVTDGDLAALEELRRCVVEATQ
ncbi:MAG TPA: maleylpyruvate isomerase N-terminal domain-containing protein [Trebonia sp.]